MLKQIMEIFGDSEDGEVLEVLSQNVTADVDTGNTTCIIIINFQVQLSLTVMQNIPNHRNVNASFIKRHCLPFHNTVFIQRTLP